MWKSVFILYACRIHPRPNGRTEWTWCPAELMEKYEYNGEAGDLRYFSQKYGIEYSVLSSRIQKKWSIERALTTPVVRRKKEKLTYNGKTMSISEWSRETGISENLITTRIYGRNWDIERALTEQPKTRNKIWTAKNEVLITCDGETHNLLEWSRITGISRHTLHARLSYGWPPEKALKTPVRGYRQGSEAGSGPADNKA